MTHMCHYTDFTVLNNDIHQNGDMNTFKSDEDDEGNATENENDDEDGEFLHPFVEVEAEEKDNQSVKSNRPNRSIAPYDADLADKLSDLPVPPQNPCVRLATSLWDDWWT